VRHVHSHVGGLAVALSRIRVSHISFSCYQEFDVKINITGIVFSIEHICYGTKCVVASCTHSADFRLPHSAVVVFGRWFLLKWRHICDCELQLHALSVKESTVLVISTRECRVIVRSVASVCLSVCLCLHRFHFLKPFRYAGIQLQNFQVRFIYEGHRVKVKVTKWCKKRVRGLSGFDRLESNLVKFLITDYQLCCLCDVMNEWINK